MEGQDGGDLAHQIFLMKLTWNYNFIASSMWINHIMQLSKMLTSLRLHNKKNNRNYDFGSIYYMPSMPHKLLHLIFARYISFSSFYSKEVEDQKLNCQSQIHSWGLNLPMSPRCLPGSLCHTWMVSWRTGEGGRALCKVGNEFSSGFCVRAGLGTNCIEYRGR